MPQSDQGIDVSLQRQRYRVIPRTLVFITRGDYVLLLRGSPQKRIWANKYNGIGGHIERNEDIYFAALREVREETGLDVEGLRLVGLINIDGDQPTGIMLFVFTAQSRAGDPIPSAEGALEWIARVKPRRAVLTNMNQELDFETLRRELPPHVEPAYDGLSIELAGA